MHLILPAALILAVSAAAAHAQAATDITAQGRTLDANLFDAYNRCDLDAFGALLAPDVEFFHDKGGLMLGRQAVVEAVERNICGKVRREPVAGKLESHPMDGYGLVQLGEHRFCETGADACAGVARFVHLWRESEGTWQVTRIISFDHQPLVNPED